MGLERAGFETIAFCEIEEFPRKVLAKHWPNVPIARDVKKLTYKDRVLYDDGIEIYRGTIDAICGGFPCQPHSFSGQRLASADPRDLWPEYARLVREIRPQWVIAENVLGLLSSESGRYFTRILWSLSAVGYDAEWFNIPGGAVGCPHFRPRIWLVAYPNETQLQGGGVSGRIYKEYANLGYTRRGKDKSGVERMANGIPSQMDRLGALGNAVVPQIPEIIGRAIMSLHDQNNRL